MEYSSTQSVLLISVKFWAIHAVTSCPNGDKCPKRVFFGRGPAVQIVTSISLGGGRELTPRNVCIRFQQNAAVRARGAGF